MNKKTKKYLSVFLSVTILLGCFSICFAAFGDDDVRIDETHFADPVFMDIVKRYDTNGDGYLSSDERILDKNLMDLTEMAKGKTIHTLKGIEYFADSLSTLRCAYLGLEELDVSALYNLTTLTCMGNELKTLDVSKNTKLITLNCSTNELTSLTLGNLPSLTFLHCYVNALAGIDVSQLPNLTNFRCHQNELTSLDVSNNTLLNNFTCADNHLTSIDLSKNTALDSVSKPAIGNQTITVPSRIVNNKIFVPLSVDDESCITTSSLGTEESNSYSSGGFIADCVDDIKDGIDYLYSTKHSDSEDMDVHIDVTRDFYQVSFYRDENMQELIGVSFAEENGTAPAPENVTAPLCKALDHWSEDITNITSDMQVYPIWKDSHAYALTDFKDGVATITCANCGDSYTVVFLDCVNAKTTDSNYCEYLDVAADGYINAKDYAQLIKMF